MPTASREPTPNVALYNLRDARGETQDQTARALNKLADKRGETTAITGNHVSRWERGTVRPSRLYSQLLSEHFGVTLAELGLTRQRPAASATEVFTDLDDLLFIDSQPITEVDVHVKNSQAEWLTTRRNLNAYHRQLAKNAAQLYPATGRITDMGLLIRPDWMWSHPVDLDAIRLEYDSSEQAPALSGAEETTSSVRPLRTATQRYARYSLAIRDVAQPTLFENRPSWRLLDMKTSQTGGTLRFGDMTYFDAMDTCEAVAHEFGATHLINGTDIAPTTWRGLKFRAEIGDPFDLSRRPVLLSINTLTIRRDRTSASVVLHNRNAANVATSGGVIGVMPAGVFQPSTVHMSDRTADFNLWHNIMREYSEEYLGNPEHDGDGSAADYTAEPFRSLNQARETGGIRIYGLGLALGALDLWAGLETVAVFDAEVFDEIFADIVHVNDEGTVVRIGKNQPTVHIPFTSEVIADLEASGRLAPETAFTLTEAWRHRDFLLGAVR